MLEGTVITQAGYYACSQQGSHENVYISWMFCDINAHEAREFARNSGLGSISWFDIGDVL